MKEHSLTSLLVASKEARDQAIAQVDRNANDEWKEAALAAIQYTAKRNEDFIVDAVWPNIGPFGETHEPRAMGPMMIRAKKLGWIQATDEFRLSAVRRHHANPRRVWKSLIYNEHLHLFD